MQQPIIIPRRNRTRSSKSSDYTATPSGTPSPLTFATFSPCIKTVLPWHSPVLVFLDTRPLLIPSSPTEQHSLLHHDVRMTWHLNSLLFLYLHVYPFSLYSTLLRFVTMISLKEDTYIPYIPYMYIENHKLPSWDEIPLGLPLKIKVPSPQLTPN